MLFQTDEWKSFISQISYVLIFFLMFHFHPTLKRVIWGISMDSNILLQSSSDVIFLNFQYFDKISKVGGW